MQSNARIFFQLCANLFAYLQYHGVLVRQIKILYQSLSKLIRRDQRLVEVPEECVA